MNSNYIIYLHIDKNLFLFPYTIFINPNLSDNVQIEYVVFMFITYNMIAIVTFKYLSPN